MPTGMASSITWMAAATTTAAALLPLPRVPAVNQRIVAAYESLGAAVVDDRVVHAGEGRTYSGSPCGRDIPDCDAGGPRLDSSSRTSVAISLAVAFRGFSTGLIDGALARSPLHR